MSMPDDTTVFAAVLLLSLGLGSLGLGALAWSQSRGGRRWRSISPLAVGGVALVIMTLLLWGTSWGRIWSDVLWPLLVVSLAAMAGAGAGLGLVYLLVAAR